MTQGSRTSRIKFGLEIATLLTAATALASVILTHRQLGLTQRQLELLAYQQIISNGVEFDKVLIEHPELRPYFKEGKAIGKDDRLYNQAALIAELQLDMIDSIIVFPVSAAGSSHVTTFPETFARAFRESPVMCEFLQERRDEYHDQTVDVAKKACRIDSPW